MSYIVHSHIVLIVHSHIVLVVHTVHSHRVLIVLVVSCYVCSGIFYPTALDDDTSYLDEAAAPSVPTTVPGAESSSGIPVDEFGLPQIPQASRE